jgi:hypothetical protein
LTRLLIWSIASGWIASLNWPYDCRRLLSKGKLHFKILGSTIFEGNAELLPCLTLLNYQRYDLFVEPCND